MKIKTQKMTKVFWVDLVFGLDNIPFGNACFVLCFDFAYFNRSFSIYQKSNFNPRLGC
jgi:hypothetical protein